MITDVAGGTGIADAEGRENQNPFVAPWLGLNLPVVVAAKEIYEFQDFHYAGPCGENSFLEDYTSAVRGVPLYVIVLVTFNADGKAQRLVVNHRPRSSLLLLSRVMLERFAGTPLAKHWEGTP